MKILTKEVLLIMSFLSCFSAITSFYMEDGIFLFWVVNFIATAFLLVAVILISNNSIIKTIPILNFIFIFVLLIIFSTIPMLLIGMDFVNSLFNSISSVTTSGLLFDIKESSILFWLASIQWLSGLFFILFSIIAFASGINKSFYPYGHFQILLFEGAGLFKTIQILKIPVLIYIFLTFLCFFVLQFSEMQIFDTIIYSFSSISTGGIMNPSYQLSDMSVFSLSVLSFFSILGSINFTLHSIISLQIYNWFVGRKNLNIIHYFLDPEVISMFILISFITAFGLFFRFNLAELIFNSISIITTTGFVIGSGIENQVIAFVLIVLLFIGGSSFSTTSGVKLSRIRSLLLHSVNNIKLSNLPYYAEGSIRHYRTPITISSNINSYIFFTSFIMFYLFVVCLFSLSFYGEDIGIMKLFALAITSACNAGNAIFIFGLNPESFSALSKVIYMFGMFLGRFEVIYPIILIFWGNVLFRSNK